jgi:lipopolysaccharide biosynthesis glycosyltransferase
MKNNQINIFFSCDDAYIPFLAVSLQSLEQNASKQFLYEIRVLHNGSISSKNMKKITNKYENDNFKITFVDVSPYIQKIADKLHTRDYYSKSTYFRLFIPNMYPNLDKALYLDSDIVINGDISKLYNIDIKNNYVGAVPDESVMCLCSEFKNYVEKRIGVDNYSQYFNAGILLMNLDILRKVDFENMFLRLISKVTFDVAQDQDYLNVICKNRVKLIDGTWNKMPINNTEILNETPNLIHYNLSFKPWKEDGILFEEYFWNYAKQTDFFDEILKIKNSYTTEMKQIAKEQTKHLMKTAQQQADDVIENERIAKIANEICGSCKIMWGVIYGRRTYRKIARQA